MITCIFARGRSNKLRFSGHARGRFVPPLWTVFWLGRILTLQPRSQSSLYIPVSSGRPGIGMLSRAFRVLASSFGSSDSSDWAVILRRFVEFHVSIDELKK